MFSDALFVTAIFAFLILFLEVASGPIDPEAGFATTGAEARWIEDVDAGVYDVQPDAAAIREAALVKALQNIRDLNTSGADEHGHKWANSDLIEQEIVAALALIDKPGGDTMKGGDQCGRETARRCRGRARVMRQ